MLILIYVIYFVCYEELGGLWSFLFHVPAFFYPHALGICLAPILAAAEAGASAYYIV